MSRMIELIRAAAVPSNIVQSAAKGALAMPAPEMIEILVYLALHNAAFGEQARRTLAGWDEKSARAMASDLRAPKEVLDYLIAPENLRPVLLPALLENVSVSDRALVELAAVASRQSVDILLKSARVNASPEILHALLPNPHLSGLQLETIRAKVAVPEAKVASPETKEVLPAAPEGGNSDPDDVFEEDLMAYLAEHAAEIAGEQDKPFHAIGGVSDEILGSEESSAEAAAAGAGTAPKSAAPKKTFLSTAEARGSALQKISKLDVKGRIQLAMKGSKEERTILVRDGTKVVALAVLESPKITDGEVEMFASQKNVLETLLRGISMKRRFMKRYTIVRNLVANPRTPLDVSLALIKNLQLNDLKNLAANKDVSDTVRKLAEKMFKQKRDVGKR
jgi:hypothetical protein